MKKNSAQFAVVREDPQIEMNIIKEFNLNRATLIGSGGCTAFCLKSVNPLIVITLIEPNAAQIELVKRKSVVLESADRKQINENFGIGNSRRDNLIECGNFESLFRQLRLFIQEFIISEDDIERILIENSTDLWRQIFAHPYWETAFELFFSDSMLTAMFTETAIQHAPKNSYPNYFRRILECGLLRSDASQNYFLHHIFLGRYLADEKSLPYYLVNLPTNFEFAFFQDFAQNFDGFKERQLADFSNIFDWCGEAEVKQIAENAAGNLESGSVIMFRQLNNQKNFRALFGNNFNWLETAETAAADRSLFYEKIEIGIKNV